LRPRLLAHRTLQQLLLQLHPPRLQHLLLRQLLPLFQRLPLPHKHLAQQAAHKTSSLLHRLRNQVVGVPVLGLVPVLLEERAV